MTGKGSTVVMGMRYATIATHSGHAQWLLIVTKWCSYYTTFEESTRIFQVRHKMESIYIQNTMKRQGSLELALEIQKERKQEIRLTILLMIFYTSGSCVYTLQFS